MPPFSFSAQPPFTMSSTLKQVPILAHQIYFNKWTRPDEHHVLFVVVDCWSRAHPTTDKNGALRVESHNDYGPYLFVPQNGTPNDEINVDMAKKIQLAKIIHRAEHMDRDELIRLVRNLASKTAKAGLLHPATMLDAYEGQEDYDPAEFHAIQILANH